MNIADQLYYDFYTLLTGVLSNSFNAIVANWQGTFIILATIAIVLIGYRQMFTSKPDIVEFFKHITVVIIVLVFVTNYDAMFDGLKFAFIDFPVAAGNYTINGIQQGIAMIGGGAPGFSSQDLSFEPTGSATAFGAMWEFATTLADRVMAEAGLSNMRAYFVGGALYLVAILLLVFQILIMAIGLLLGAACILAAPVFVWMIMFKPLKPMFEKWLTMGVGAGILLYFLIVVMGIILAFMGNAVMEVMGYNIFTESSDALNDPNRDFNAKEFTATMLFMAIAIKLLPKTENWASSLSAFSVHGVTQAADTVGGWIGDKIKNPIDQAGALSKKGASAAGQKGYEASKKGVTAAASALAGARDRIMTKRMESDNLESIENKTGSTSHRSETDSSRAPDFSNVNYSKIDGQNNEDDKYVKPSSSHQLINKDAQFGESSNSQSSNTNQRDATVNQNINQDVKVDNSDNSIEHDSDNISEGVGSKERQEIHADKNRVGHDNMSRIDREQNAATKRLRNEVKQIQASGVSGEQAQAELAASHQAEIQRVSDSHSGAELSKLKKNIGKEFDKLHKSLEADKPMKAPKKAERVESKDLKDE